MSPTKSGQILSCQSPQIRKGRPITETPLRILGIIRWCSGTGIFLLLSQTRSPRTPLEAQLSVERGFGNMRGLNQVQAMARAIATKDHHPHQARLQMARIRSGSTVILVYTLQGLVCRCQVSSDMANHWAILDSIVCFIYNLFFSRTINVIHQVLLEHLGANN